MVQGGPNRYECTNCGYRPMSSMSHEEKVEEMVMHYGVSEDLAIQSYEGDCKRWGLDKPQSGQEPDQLLTQELDGIVCKMCDSNTTGMPLLKICTRPIEQGF